MIRRAILCTNHLNRWAGSEVVLCEIAEALTSLGADVTILCNSFSDDLARPLANKRVAVTDSAEELRLADVDLLYCHHQLASLLVKRLMEGVEAGARMPVMVYNHLSPFDPFELPGPFVEQRLADLIFCNSRETADRLRVIDRAFETVRLFPNPAPRAFLAEPHVPRTRLKSLLVVSNHLPKEADAALRELRNKGIIVRRIGRKFEHRRLEPNDIHDSDAVMTIGKTVQYALAARVPVYCYDHFSGPGWLGEDNFESAANRNFSGRSHPEKKSGTEIASEVIAGFAEADAWVQNLPRAQLEPFLLDGHMARLVAAVEQIKSDPERDNVHRALARDAAFLARVDQEAAFYGLLRKLSRRANQLEQRQAPGRLTRLLRRLIGR